MDISVVINTIKHSVPSGITILQACEKVGLPIPRFCYHDRLSVAGNCRMCLVQVDKSVKPVASCAVQVSSEMVLFTDTIMVKKAREGVMEFLLSNHPLDCPICDQGGECDLQDQSLVFGNDRGRFYEIKRAVSDKNWGPLIKTVMTRCIHCTRCVRYSNEYTSSVDLGVVGRGSSMEITNYLNSLIVSEVSGNVIDLCPVGALTSKPYAFTSRPWELTKILTTDMVDQTGSNLSIEVSNQRILRVLPVLNVFANDEWLSDRSRFSYSSFRLQRLSSRVLNFPFVIPSYLIVGMVSYTEAVWLKRISSLDSIMTYSLNVDFRSFYLSNISFILRNSLDSILLFSIDLKKESPLLLMKLRLSLRSKHLSIFSVGSPFDYSLSSTFNLGNSLSSLVKTLEGRSYFSFFWSRDSLFLTNLNYSKFLFLRTSFTSFLGASNNQSVNKCELGLSSTYFSQRLNSIFVKTSVSDPFSLYAGSHGLPSIGQNYLPLSHWVEQTGFTINSEGLFQTLRPVFKSTSLMSLSSLFFSYHYKAFSFLSLEKNILNSFLLSTFNIDFLLPQTYPNSLHLNSGSIYFSSLDTFYSSLMIEKHLLLLKSRVGIFS